MPYQSPFTYFALPLDSPLTAETLRLTRKRFLAELDLAGTTTLKIGGQEFSKNDLVQYFDNLNVSEIEYHRHIANDAVLLAFLENKLNTKTAGRPLQENPIYEESDDFRQFISPYFATAFREKAIEAIQKRNNVTMKWLFSLPKLITYSNLSEVYEEMHYAFQNKADIVTETTQRYEKAQKAQFKRQFDRESSKMMDYYHLSFIQLLNELPEYEFGSFRNSYALDLYNYAAIIWNKEQYIEAYAVMQSISKLFVDDYERDLIEKRIAFFQKEMKRINVGTTTENSGQSWWSSWRITIFVFIFLVRVIPMFFEDSTPKNYTPPPPYKYSVDTTLFQQEMTDLKKNTESIFQNYRIKIEKYTYESQTNDSLKNRKVELEQSINESPKSDTMLPFLKENIQTIDSILNKRKEK